MSLIEPRTILAQSYEHGAMLLCCVSWPDNPHTEPTTVEFKVAVNGESVHVTPFLNSAIARYNALIETL